MTLEVDVKYKLFHINYANNSGKEYQVNNIIKT